MAGAHGSRAQNGSYQHMMTLRKAGRRVELVQSQARRTLLQSLDSMHIEFHGAAGSARGWVTSGACSHMMQGSSECRCWKADAAVAKMRHAEIGILPQQQLATSQAPCCERGHEDTAHLREYCNPVGAYRATTAGGSRAISIKRRYSKGGC
eukprot:TRINITY_DN191_c0_g1_i5.p1 TRINITY_DN191_c0_g1~~TRINITY_DN191_c0_g1_i5.p1  ORF type:complete len:151 (-),score=16.50 TRINITY_DN191_c0_g1_i5:68-520(-)